MRTIFSFISTVLMNKKNFTTSKTIFRNHYKPPRLFICIIALMVILCQHQSFCYAEWSKAQPAGSTNASDIDYWVATVNNTAIDLLAKPYRVNATLMYSSVSTFTVLPGTIAIPNSDGSDVNWRTNTSSVTGTWADIDTGAENDTTQYYVYAVADADATTFTVKISTSSTTPTGVTNYRRIGYFYNDASSNIVSVGNDKGGDVGNTISVEGTTSISTSSGTYSDMTDMAVYFVSTGRQVRIILDAPCRVTSASVFFLTLDIDGTDKGSRAIICASAGSDSQATAMWQGTLSAGAHVIKAQWKAGAGTVTQSGTTNPREMIVEEL